MTRLRVLMLVVLVLCATSVRAHEVPDRVAISVFIKPVNGELVMLVRMPANALIDFLLPTLSENNWLDLANATPIAEQGARVWIADMLSVTENGRPLPAPQVIAVRLSRVNDPAFRTFDEALGRVNGGPLPADTLVTQDQVTVDALLRTPIQSPDSTLSFTPRFARLGVVVDTTLTFLPPRGGIRSFQYQGDPDTFEVDPDWRQTATRLTIAGFTNYSGESDYLLFVLCGALAIRKVRALLAFTATLVGTQVLVLLGSMALMPTDARIRGLYAVLISAATVYLGIEAIIAREGRRLGLAIGSGAVMGCGLWLALHPIIQFGGTHPLVADLAFTGGVVAAELIAVAIGAGIVQLIAHLSRAPQFAIVVVAAFAIHIEWRRLLDRADALALMMGSAPAINPVTLAIGVAVAIAVIVGLAQRPSRVRAAT